MKLYLDMDGVLVDFFGGLEKMHNVDHWKDIPDLETVLMSKRNTSFFNDLDCFKDAHALVEYAKLKWDWGICSSPLKDDHNNSAYWKRVWLDRHGFLPKIENLIFTSNKHHYATDGIDGTPNVLVDDKPANIKRWEQAGGLGVLYQANEHNILDVMHELENIFNREG